MYTSVFIYIVVVLSYSILCSSKIRKFPDDFDFGVSTAAYQIEGGAFEDGKGLSIWDIMTHTEPSPIDDGSTGDMAADSYHLYKRDVQMMSELGVDFYRFSISWPRILPTGFPDKVNELGVKYYNNLIDEMVKHNVTPFVTLYHWDLPENLQKLGGWSNPHVVNWFTDYCNVLFEKFGDKVKHWITINEPKQICYEGYGSDAKAPMVNSTGIADYMCSKNVLLAHAKAYRLYDEVYRKGQQGVIGISISFTWFEPASDSPDDSQAAQDARQFDWGLYAHPIFTKSGDYPLEVRRNVAVKSAEQGYARPRLPELSNKEVVLIKGTSDFIGVNTYTTKLAYRDPSIEEMYVVPSYMDDMGVILHKDAAWPQSASPWLQEVPWGLYKLLKEIKKLYGNPPVYITENGWSTTGGLFDDDRVQYIRNYLNSLLDAISEGCDVKGYTAWSLMDNFEWKHGYKEKFGLYEVDFNHPKRPRSPRKSAFVYKEIIRTRSLDPLFDPMFEVRAKY